MNDRDFYRIYGKKIEAIKKSESIGEKIKILLLADIPNWAFDNIAKAIIKYNKFSFIEYTIHYLHDENYLKKTFNYNDWNYVYVFFEGERNIPISKQKLIRGCYSAFWLETNLFTEESLAKNIGESRAIVYANENLKEQLSKYSPNTKSVVITDAADIECFYPVKSLKNNKFTVLFVGNTGRKIKRFEIIEKICEKAGVVLEVAEKIKHEELFKIYNKAHVCINFSVSEGGPQTFFEAALCEVPMLINSDIPMSEKIPCFTADTEEEMVEQLMWLKENPKECEIVGKNARNVVLNNYTYERYLNKNN